MICGPRVRVFEMTFSPAIRSAHAVGRAECVKLVWLGSFERVQGCLF